MTATFRLIILAVLPLAIALAAEDRQATPRAAFDTLMKAVATKDIATFQAIILTASPETEAKLLKQFPLMPDAAREANKAARFIEVKIAGDHACAIVLSLAAEKPGSHWKLTEQFFARRDGKWRVCMGPIKAPIVPDAKARELREWYHDRIEAPDFVIPK